MLPPQYREDYQQLEVELGQTQVDDISEASSFRIEDIQAARQPMKPNKACTVRVERQSVKRHRGPRRMRLHRQGYCVGSLRSEAPTKGNRSDPVEHFEAGRDIDCGREAVVSYDVHGSGEVRHSVFSLLLGMARVGAQDMYVSSRYRKSIRGSETHSNVEPCSHGKFRNPLRWRTNEKGEKHKWRSATKGGELNAGVGLRPGCRALPMLHRWVLQDTLKPLYERLAQSSDRRWTRTRSPV